MKRFKIILSLLLIFIFISIPVSAKNNIIVYMNGKATEVREVPVMMDGKPVYSDVPTYIHKGSTMVPLRFVAEHYGAEVGWDNKTKSAKVVHNGKNVVMTIDKSTVKVNNETKTIENNATPKLVNTGTQYSNTMVPLRFISETLGYEVGYDEEKGIPFINGSEEIEATSEGITDISLVKGSTDISKLNVKSTETMDVNYSKDGNNINITINNTSLKDKDLSSTNLSGNPIGSVKVSENGNKVNISVSLNDNYEYELLTSNDGKEFTLLPVSRVTSIKKETVDGKAAIVISRDKATKVNRSSLSNPKRYIFDIMDSSLGTDYKEYNISIEGISNVRASQFSPSGSYNSNDRIVRVVVDMSDNSNIEVSNKEEKIIITPDEGKETEEPIEPETPESGIKNIIKYDLTGRISNLEINLKKKSNYKVDYNENNRMINITVSKDSIEETSGEMNIQDGMVDNIKFTESGSDVKIAVKLSRKLIVEDLNKGNGNSIKLKIEREATGKPSDRVIVIDPGHGGVDPGAVSNGIKEKDIVLDVSKKVESLLKQKGYNTLMTREDDTYISLGGRANLANGEDADLFVSIHANSYSGTAAKGIEVLHNGDTKSKALAQDLQDELVKGTGATDRGIKHRPNLAVLRQTKMPSSLVELGFITNEEEVNNLTSVSYQNKLAEAIVKGIEKFFSIFD